MATGITKQGAESPDPARIAAVEALAAGAARGLTAALCAERPDLAWEVDVRPIDRAELARLWASTPTDRMEAE